jgi:uncharacterized membrane protein
MASRAFALIDAVAARRPPTPRRKANIGRGERVGSALTGAALLTWALSRRTVGGTLVGVVGGALVYRGVRGRSRLYEAVGITTGERVDRVERVASVNRRPEDVYALCRDVANLPRLLPDVLAVTPTGAGARWVGSTPRGETRTWHAELAADTPGELIRWRGEDGPGVWFTFRRTSGDRGTEVRIALEDATAAEAESALARLKQLAEAGEIATTGGQPAGRPD